MAKPVNEDESVTVAIERLEEGRNALGREAKRIGTLAGLAGP